MHLSFFYFDLQYAVKEHDFIIENSGGRHGSNNIGLLESTLEHIKNDWYYPSIEDKATYLCYSINKNHAFTDGNKRSSIVLTSYFLEINGLSYCTTRFVLEMENFAVYVAANYIDQVLLHQIITSILYENDYSEELKLKIAKALSTHIDDSDMDAGDESYL